MNLDAKYAIAVYNRGNAHFAKGDADRAIANYDQALALNPKYEDALVNRGVAHEKKGALDRAIADYDEAIKLEPKDAVAYNNRGNALLKKGDYDRAIADYDRAIKLDGKYVAAYFSRAIANEGKKRFDDAIADYGQVTKLQPQNAAAWNSRCWTRAIIGRLQEALGDCNEALKLKPDYINALDSRGFVLLRMGRLRRGHRRLRRGAADRCRTRSPRCMGAAWPSAARATTPSGNIDIAAAKAIKPSVAAEFSRYGLLPPLTDAVRSDFPTGGVRVRPRRQARIEARFTERSVAVFFWNLRPAVSVDLDIGNGGVAMFNQERHQGTHGSLWVPTASMSEPWITWKVPTRSSSQRATPRPAAQHHLIPDGLGRPRRPARPSQQVEQGRPGAVEERGLIASRP